MAITERLDDRLLEEITADEHGRPNDRAPLVNELLAISADIERAHGRAVRQANRDARKAMARYLRQVLADYERGVKRVVPRKARVARWSDGTAHCANCHAKVVEQQNYCSGCGARLGWSR